MKEEVKNLIKEAFEGETKAIISYYRYADVARNEGRPSAAELFERMAKNEIEHAKVWHAYLYEEPGDTSKNLIDAANGENYEWKEMYPRFAQKAREMGMYDVADKFERIASIECEHERRFVEENMAKEEIAKEQLQQGDKYMCLFCGFATDVKPDVCPVCDGSDCFIVE